MPDVPAPVATQGVQQPDILKSMLGVSEIQRNRAATQNLQSETYQRDYNTMSEQLVRAAHDVLAQPEGPARTARWNYYVNDFQKRGYIDEPSAKQWYNNPSELVLNQAIRHGMNPAAVSNMTGTTEGLTARNRAAWEYRDLNPDTRAGYPAQTQGNLGVAAPPGMLPGGGPQQGPLGATTGPMAVTGPKAGTILPGPGPAPATPQVPPPVQPAANPIQPVQATDSMILPQRPATPGGPAPAAQTPENVPEPAKPYYNEVEPIKTWPDAKTGPGIVNPGRHPQAIKAQDAANEKMEKEITPALQRAVKGQSELSPLVAELERGKVSTDRLASIRMDIAGVIYGATKNYELAKKISGVDLSEQEMAQKIMMTRGLKFDRETEGARMAVMAIQIGNLANPQIVATEAANLKMAKYLMAGMEYDKQTANAAQGYMLKQQDKTGTGHLIGFDQYMNNQHPPSQFVSKIIPFSLPESKANMMKNTTYEWDIQDPKDPGKPLIDPRTHLSVTKRAIWDGKNLVPVE